MKSIDARAPRGTYDILPEESHLWSFLMRSFEELCERYGYGKISTPVFEETKVFERGVGESTDIVRKEMYRFKDQGNRDLVLRPEGTAGVVRAFVQHKLYGKKLPLKVFYSGPMFRYERPQSGRYRQHQQVGVEVFGSAGSMIDAEVIALLIGYYELIGVKGTELLVNSMGHPGCRQSYVEELKGYLGGKFEGLCDDCKARIDLNPLRGFDCKVKDCIGIMKAAPKLIDHICDDCLGHFEGVKAYLGDLGLSFSVDSSLVRGFDYYTRTTFEVRSPLLGAQNAIGGGGRYDDLVEEFGGPATPGLGFAIGMERTMLALAREGEHRPQPKPLSLFLIALGEEAEKKAFSLLHDLRRSGVSADMDYMGRSLKAQMKLADRLGVAKVAIIGEDELKSGKALLRDMKSGQQSETDFSQLIKCCKN